MVERGHQGFLAGLAKMVGPWVQNLPAVIWAERVSLRRPLGYSPAQLVLGQNPLLPIELAVPSWQSLPWDEVQTQGDLLAVRGTQLQVRKERVEEAVHRTRRLRREAVESRNDARGPAEDIGVGDMVLVWDSIKAIDKSSEKKLQDRWVGPWKVVKAVGEKGYYQLADLNGVEFASTVRADRIKRFKQLAPEVEDTILRGRLRIYPKPNRLQTPTPPRSGSAPVSPPAATTIDPVSPVAAERAGLHGAEKSIWKGYEISTDYVPNRTTNNAPRRADDRISSTNILGTSRRGVLIPGTDSESE